MADDDKFIQLVNAVRLMLTRRYADGFCDGMATATLEDTLDEILGEDADPKLLCRHMRLTSKPGDELCQARLGCLDCEQWLEPVKFWRP